MFYKVLPGNDTYKELQDLQAQISDAYDQAKALVKEFGGTNFADKAGFGTLRGGIRYVFMTTQRKGWNKTSQKDVYYAGVRAKEDNERISKLPKVSCDCLNQILGYTEWERPNPESCGSIITFHPVVQWKKEVVAIKVNTQDPYRPSNPDIQEITRSEYEAIVNAEKVEG
jgi:hypothetical protein